MRKRRPIELFSISLLDLLSGALGAVIILYVAIPKKIPNVILKDNSIEIAYQKKLSENQITIQHLEKKLEEEKKKNEEVLLTKTQDSNINQVKVPEGSDLDVGFKFKGKEIVFIIDTSYSMVEDDRMGQVKAGIKMLLTSLGAEYNVEIVHFPLGQRAPFRSMWGATKEFKGHNRLDAFDFVYALRPSGGTPTRETLLFVLKNYENLSDIILLTDGVPTYHNSNKKDDIFDILKVVREANLNKVQINTIGVGADFLKDHTSEQYKFLSLLSSESNGFFVGF